MISVMVIPSLSPLFAYILSDTSNAYCLLKKNGSIAALKQAWYISVGECFVCYIGQLKMLSAHEVSPIHSTRTSKRKYKRHKVF